MAKIYYVEIADDTTGEVEGFFDEQGKFIHGWCRNDANWRGEYMDPLLQALGYTVEYSTNKKLTAKLRKEFDNG